MYREGLIYILLVISVVGMQRVKKYGQNLSKEVRELEEVANSYKERIKGLRKQYDALAHPERIQTMVAKLKMKPIGG